MDIFIYVIIFGLILTIILRLHVYEWLTGYATHLFRHTRFISDPRQPGPYPPVTFTVRVCHAKRVYIAGSFNEWLRTSFPGARITHDPAYKLYRKEDDTWEITLYDLMPKTKYEYAFAVDYGMGYFQWIKDPRAKECGYWGFSEILISESRV